MLLPSSPTAQRDSPALMRLWEGPAESMQLCWAAVLPFETKMEVALLPCSALPWVHWICDGRGSRENLCGHLRGPSCFLKDSFMVPPSEIQVQQPSFIPSHRFYSFYFKLAVSAV